MKDRLIFDTTDANTIADGDSVGAYIRASGGELIDSQTINAQEWLNTASVLYDDQGAAYNAANPIPVDLVSPISVAVDMDGVYDVATNPTPDSVGAIYHTRAAAPGAAEQVERSTVAILGTVASADLANVHAQDTNAFMYAIDDVSGDAETLTKDGVSGGLNVHLAGSDVTIDVSDAALANTAILSTAKALTAANTAEALLASALAGRKYLWIRNNDNRIMYVGGSGVSAANGFPVSPGSYVEMRCGPAVSPFFVSEKIAHDSRLLQLS